MGKLREIVIDADHPASLARFWAAAIDGYAVRRYDDAEIARLAAKGLTPETDPFVLIDGPGPIVCCQTRTGGPRPLGGRIHLDIAAPDRDAEVARLRALGATVSASTSGDARSRGQQLLRRGVARVVRQSAGTHPIHFRHPGEGRDPVSECPRSEPRRQRLLDPGLRRGDGPWL